MKLYRINALLLKSFYITVNKLDRIFDLVYWPLIDLFVWGFTTYFLSSVSQFNLLSMFLGGVILWLFVWRSSQDIAVFILEDFWSRNLYNLFTSPITSGELVTAVSVFSFIRAVVSFIFMVVLAFIVYSFNIFSIGIFHIALFVPALLMTGWVLGLLVSAMIFRYGQRIQVFAWSVVWGIQPFSCIFYPLSVLPKWAQGIAILLPTTHIFEGLRAVLSGKPISIAGLLYAYLLSLMLLILAALFLGRSIEHARKTGLLTRIE